MRCLLIVALAAVVASIAHAAEQDKAKALEDRWPQCSEVVKGRFGAFHPFDQAGAGADWAPVSSYGSFVQRGGFSQNVTVTYRPCAQAGDSAALQVIREWDSEVIATFSQVIPVDGRNLKFNMPLKVGDVANFVGTYTQAVDKTKIATVTTSCNADAGDMVVIKSITESNSTAGVYDFQLESKYACSMFPYSNRAMPPGGVAALVIVIIACVAQFGIAVWYHKTQTIGENPFTTAGDYTNVE